jgi:hypothetical protein
MRVPPVSQQRDTLFPLETTRFGSFQPAQHSLYELSSSQGCGAELELQEGPLRAFRWVQACTAVNQQSYVPLLERHPRTNNAFGTVCWETSQIGFKGRGVGGNNLIVALSMVIENSNASVASPVL